MWKTAGSPVPGGGLEPPRAEARRILSPVRLPIPPSRRMTNNAISGLKPNVLAFARKEPNDGCGRLSCQCGVQRRGPLLKDQLLWPYHRS